MNLATTSDSILSHWPWIVAAYFLVSAVQALPSPNQASAAWYKWVFGTMHLTVGALPRLIVTLFPQYSKFIPGGTNGSQAQANATPATPPTPAP